MRRLPAALITILTVVLATGCSAVGPVPESESLPEGSQAPEISAGVTAIHTSLPVLPNTAELSPPGPYLLHRVPPEGPDSGLAGGNDDHVLDRHDTIVVRHADGSLEATWRMPEGGAIDRVSDALSPDGRQLVFFSGDVPDWHLADPITTPLTLHVWDLASGGESFATPVLRPGVREDLRRQVEESIEQYDQTDLIADESWDAQDDSLLAFYAEDVVLALLEGVGDVKWSPDGRRLAFVGALDGPSGDVYVLDTDDWSVTRVSNEPTHVIQMSWSPDGRWILHEGSPMSRRGVGAPVGETTHVSAADGSSQRHVWGGSNLDAGGGMSWPDAWIGDHDAVVHSEGNGCGVCQIVRVDAGSGTTETLVSRLEAGDFVVDRGGTNAALPAKIYTGDNRRGPLPYVEGVHVLQLYGSGTNLVHDRWCRVGLWDGDGLPFVWLPTHGKVCTTTAFGTNGRELIIDDSSEADHHSNTSVSPNGLWRVLYGDSGWQLYDRQSTLRSARIAYEAETGGRPHWSPVAAVTWSPDESRLFWVAEGGLWVAEIPDGEPRLVGPWSDYASAEGSLDVAWLWP